MGPIERTSVEDFHSGQLVVDLPHVDMVLARLGVELDTAEQDGAPSAQPGERPGLRANKDLGLALLDLESASLEARANELRSDQEFAKKAVAAQPFVYREEQRTIHEIPDLDILMFELRRKFAAEFDGWCPDMGKNREVDGIEGSPGISGGGEGPPIEADADTFDQIVISPTGKPKRSEPVRIGLLDTQLYHQHGRLTKVQTTEFDRLKLQPEPIPMSAGHATFIAGIITARAPEAVLVVRAVLSRETATASLWDTAEAMVRLGRDRVDLINMSWVYTTADHEPSLILARAIDKVREFSSEVIFVAAAGNHGMPQNQKPNASVNANGRRPLPPNRPVHPAATPGVIAVGSFKEPTSPSSAPEPATFSPQPAPWIDLGAPGDNVVSTYLKGLVQVREKDVNGVVKVRDIKFATEFARWSGTSFAAGYVTGEIARLMGGLPARVAVRQLLNGPPDSVVQPYPRQP